MAPTTGSVLYTAEDNALIHEGDILMALEACKVEIPIKAPCDGIVTFKVIPGEVVGADTLLAVIRSRTESRKEDGKSPR